MVQSLRIVRAQRDRLDELEHLWRSLQEHHVALGPTLGGLPARSPEESWLLRRRKYAAALEDPDAFLLLAEAPGGPVGYALVTLAEGPRAGTTVSAWLMWRRSLLRPRLVARE